MYQLSQTLSAAIAAGNPQRVLLEFTAKPDGTAYSPSVVFSNEDISIETGLRLSCGFVSSTNLTIGECPSAEIQFTMLNDNGQLANFEFGTFNAYLGAKITSGSPASGAKTKTFSDGLYEFAPLGTFVAPRPDVVMKYMIDVDANDQMTLFDVDMPSASALGVTYPTTLAELFKKMCAYVGVGYVSDSFLNADLTIDAEPEQLEESTMREVMQWIAEAACSNARFTRDGLLELAWFNMVQKTYAEGNYKQMTSAWYETAAIDGLHIRNADSTEEYVYGAGTNAYMIQDNPFLRQKEVDNRPVITAQPVNVATTAGSTATFQVSSSNATGYQWKYSENGSAWTTIAANDSTYSGGTTDTLTFTVNTTTTARRYKCTLTLDGAEQDTVTVTATAVELTILQHPQNAAMVANGNITFTVEAANAERYQWQRSTNNGTSWSNMSGQTEPSLTVTLTSANESYLYRCRLTCGNTTLTSNSAKGVIVAIAITTQPVNVVANIGDTVSLYVTAVGATAYAWKMTTNGGTSWAGLQNASWVTGADSDTITFVATEQSAGAGIGYRCVASNDFNRSVTSNKADVEIGAIQITNQPVNVENTVNASVSFTAFAANATAYKWQSSSDNGGTWADITGNDYTGASTGTLEFTLTAATAALQYRCKLSNTSETAYTNAVTATIAA